MKKKIKPRKLSRSEVVTVRFSPKLKYGLELGARQQHRTSSSFIEWAVMEALGSVDGNRHATIEDLLDDVWDTEPADRLMNLIKHDRRLLSFEETIIMKVLNEHKGFFWKGKDSPNLPRIRRCWEQLLAISTDDLDIGDLVDPNGGAIVDP